MKKRVTLVGLLAAIAFVAVTVAVAFSAQEWHWWSLNKGGCLIQKGGESYLKLSKPGHFVSAKHLVAILNDDDISNDPLVLSVRKPKHYKAGHIPGAVNFGYYDSLGSRDKVEAIEKALKAHVDKGGKAEILVYCYTGHTAGIVTGVLGTLGFNAKNLKHGMCQSWNNDPSVGCGKSATLAIPGYPVETE